jgi:hypothetical protein
MLREVRVTYSDGRVINTSMAAGVTDAEIRAYYRIGSRVVIGMDEKEVSISKVEILR